MQLSHSDFYLQYFYNALVTLYIGYRFYSAVEPPPRTPHIFRDLVYPFTLQAVGSAVVSTGQNALVTFNYHLRFVCELVTQL